MPAWTLLDAKAHMGRPQIETMISSARDVADAASANAWGTP